VWKRRSKVLREKKKRESGPKMRQKVRFGTNSGPYTGNFVMTENVNGAVVGDYSRWRELGTDASTAAELQR
jgi:hypothetical protein